MARLLKEREVDQELWEALNFSMRDDEDLLEALHDIVQQDVADTERTAEADRLASEAEERARTRAAAAEHELQMARHELTLAHEQRMTTKKVHQAAKKRQESERRIVKSLRLHIHRSRLGIAEWGGFKGFADDQLVELQLMAAGGLKRLVDAHRHRTAAALEASERSDPEMSESEAEAI